ncbi:hypothetical protein MnTg02_01067 [bacterium MnTg02]|nr:hypothetical protein MnTg02_01067 [bacterium MnTg02]
MKPISEVKNNGFELRMPSLIRFLTVCGVLAGVIFGSLYVLAEYFEPDTKEISKPVRNIKVR